MDSNVRKIWIWSFEYAFEIIAIMKQIMLNLQYSFKVQKKSILRRGKIDIRLLSLNCGLSLSQIQWQDFASFGFVRCCYISVLVLTCFHLTKGRITHFRPEIIVASFLHLTVLLFKVLFNHSKQHTDCFKIYLSDEKIFNFDSPVGMNVAYAIPLRT